MASTFSHQTILMACIFIILKEKESKENNRSFLISYILWFSQQESLRTSGTFPLQTLKIIHSHCNAYFNLYFFLVLDAFVCFLLCTFCFITPDLIGFHILSPIPAMLLFPGQSEHNVLSRELLIKGCAQFNWTNCTKGTNRLLFFLIQFFPLS